MKILTIGLMLLMICSCTHFKIMYKYTWNSDFGCAKYPYDLNIGESVGDAILVPDDECDNLSGFNLEDTLYIKKKIKKWCRRNGRCD